MRSLVSALLVGVTVASAAAAVDPVAPSPGAEVAVPVLEKYHPLTTKIVVGKNAVDAAPDFQIMFSFKAFAFNAANALASNCFGVYDNGRAWKAIPTLPYSSRPDEEPAFCVRRDIVEEDPESFVVAQFPHEDPANASLVTWSSSSLAVLTAEAKIRGWTQDPVAPIRVRQLHVWQAVPLLTLITDVTAITAETEADALAQCPPDPDGLVDRKIDGGNYYKDVPDEIVMMLCVSYVQRSIHRIEPKERFYSDTRLVVKSIWRLSMCPLVSDAVQDVGFYDDAKFRAKDDDDLLLCYMKMGLFEDDDEAKPITDARPLLKRITITDAVDGYEKRLQIDPHDKDAWIMTPSSIDPAVIDQF